MAVDADVGGRGRGEVMRCYVRADRTKWAFEKHCGCARARPCVCVCEWWACRRTIKPVSSFHRHTLPLVIPFLLRLFCSSPRPSSLLFLWARLVYSLSPGLRISTSPSSLHLSSFILLLFPSLASPTVQDFCPVSLHVRATWAARWAARGGWHVNWDSNAQFCLRNLPTCSELIVDSSRLETQWIYREILGGYEVVVKPLACRYWRVPAAHSYK